MHFPYPLLVADIGGTHARLALVTRPGDALRPLPVQETADFPGLPEAADAALAGTRHAIASLVVCAAGPVIGRTVALTNAGWKIDGAQIADRMGLAQGLLLNDFEAQALALPVLRAQWLRQIGPLEPRAHGVRLVLGPGTGLGVAALLETATGALPVATEAGHVDFGSVGAEQERFWPHLTRVEGRITAETVLSGPGLARLHAARLAADGQPPGDLAAPDIVARACANPEGEEAATARLFWRLLARFAGDLALVFRPAGGVTMAGGLAPRLASLLDEADFRRAFEDKAPMRDLVAQIPTALLVADDTVLHGLAALAANPERSALDYAARAWRAIQAA